MRFFDENLINWERGGNDRGRFGDRFGDFGLAGDNVNIRSQTNS
jgi:hypothetical protein